MNQAVFITERIQMLAAKVLATHAAGRGLCLVGGFRYRMLDGSARASLDLDYHWDGDLVSKQAEIAEVSAANCCLRSNAKLDSSEMSVWPLGPRRIPWRCEQSN
jgi:hypothetical protein